MNAYTLTMDLETGYMVGSTAYMLGTGRMMTEPQDVRTFMAHDDDAAWKRALSLVGDAEEWVTVERFRLECDGRMVKEG